MKPRKITIQQALHGYNEGHRSLACSTDLSGTAQQILIEQSDLSGPSIVAGFSTYLSAFPLHEDSLYCISRTWDAPEMARPGCVWTHSLLIPFSELPSVGWEVILTLPHLRPDSQDFSAYADAIDLDVPEGIESFSRCEKAEAIAMAWSRNPESTLYISAENSSSFESAIVRFWSGQWPKLRRWFAFSTGSIRDRKPTSFMFDVQVFPRLEARLFERSLPKDSRFLPEGFEPKSSPLERVMLNALQLERNDLAAHDFTFRYGADLVDPKQGFKALCETFLLLNKQSKRIKDLFDHVASSFPKATDARKLKDDLLAFPSVFFSLPDQIAVLELLHTSNNLAAFKIPSCAIAGRIRELWPDYSSRIIDGAAKAIKAIPAGRSEEYLDEVATLISEEDIPALREALPDSWVYFAAKNDALARSTGCWDVTTREQISLLRALQSCIPLELSTWQPIISLLFRYDSNELAEYVAANFSSVVAEAFVNEYERTLLTEKSIANVAPSWRRILREPFLKKLGVDLAPERGNPMALATSLVVLLPRDYLGLSFSSDTWRLVFEIVSGAHRSDSRSESLFLVVAAGLVRAPGLEPALILRAAREVHRILASNRYTDRAWHLLEPFLPHLAFWKEWDRCEKLRQAISELYESDKSTYRQLSGEKKGRKIKNWMVNFIQKEERRS